ncbi:MAG: hypothetical protein RSE31_08530 [Anaerovoracaceae bacterium]
MKSFLYYTITLHINSEIDRIVKNRETFTNEYDLGDGCTLRIELSDKQEGENVPMATRNSGDLWKAYGNRSFTASASVQCKVGTANMQLENYYTLSENGIDENYGVSSADLNTETGIIAFSYRGTYQGQNKGYIYRVKDVQSI